jgi:hypothetical protein
LAAVALCLATFFAAFIRVVGFGLIVAAKQLLVE